MFLSLLICSKSMLFSDEFEIKSAKYKLVHTVSNIRNPKRRNMKFFFNVDIRLLFFFIEKIDKINSFTQIL